MILTPLYHNNIHPFPYQTTYQKEVQPPRVKSFNGAKENKTNNRLNINKFLTTSHLKSLIPTLAALQMNLNNQAWQKAISQRKR